MAEIAITATQETTLARNKVADALRLPSGHLYQYELDSNDLFYPPRSSISHQLDPSFSGQLAVGTSLLFAVETTLSLSSNYARFQPKVPVGGDRLIEQPTHGLVIGLGRAAFTPVRLTIISRSEAKQLAAAGRVFDPRLAFGA